MDASTAGAPSSSRDASTQMRRASEEAIADMINSASASASAALAPTAAAELPWSPYTAWSGDLPSEPCDLYLYALLWLEAVALAQVA